ncbi:hypothetical protein LTR94_027193, partial [Friedmanniomyces endolithicus]
MIVKSASLLGAVALFCTACAAPSQGGSLDRISSVGSGLGRSADQDDARPTVKVVRDGQSWTAEFEFDRDAQAWAFVRSEVIQGVRRPWRLEQWRVVTPGVVLDRINGRDLLRSTDGGPVPRRVQISLEPRSVDIEAGYGSLAFTNGAVALPTTQFDIFPTRLEAVRGLPEDLNGIELGGRMPLVIWRDKAGPVLLDAERVQEARTQDRTAYVLFGQVETLEGADMTVLMDPALPSWISRQVGSFAPQASAYYARRLGPGQTDRPSVMISWRGPTERVTSMGGSVVPGVIVMSFEGSG